MHGAAIRSDLYARFVRRQKPGVWPRATWTLLAVSLAAIGCAPLHRAPLDFRERLVALDTVTLVPPRVTIYQVTAGGVYEEKVHEGAQASRTLAASIERELRELEHLRFVEYPDFAKDRTPSEAGLTALDENWALFEAVAESILLHTYPDSSGTSDHVFAQRVHGFDYTLGPEAAEVVEGVGADAFIFAMGVEYQLTFGRAVLEAAAVAATDYRDSKNGAPVPRMPGRYSGPVTQLILALVEARSGDIVWFAVTNPNEPTVGRVHEPDVRAAMESLAPKTPR